MTEDPRIQAAADRIGAAMQLIQTHPTLNAPVPESMFTVAEEISVLRKSLALATCQSQAALIALRKLMTGPGNGEALDPPDVLLAQSTAEAFDAFVEDHPERIAARNTAGV